MVVVANVVGDVPPGAGADARCWTVEAEAWLLGSATRPVAVGRYPRSSLVVVVAEGRVRSW